MPKRSPERHEFLSDIITTALEGGIGYWSACSHYQFEYDGEVTLSVGRRLRGQHTMAIIHEINDDETGYKDENLKVTVEVVATGLRRYIEHLAESSRKNGIPEDQNHWLVSLREADRENYAGNIDASDADEIVQMGLFGEVRYG